MRKCFIRVINAVNIIFFNKAEEYSIICPECYIEMKEMGSEFVDSEVEKKRTEAFQR